MFSGNFQEKIDNQSHIKIGGDISSKALQQIVDYFYTGQLCVNQENVVELLEIADLLLLQQVCFHRNI